MIVTLKSSWAVVHQLSTVNLMWNADCAGDIELIHPGTVFDRKKKCSYHLHGLFHTERNVATHFLSARTQIYTLVS